jgi:hypothetical protein
MKKENILIFKKVGWNEWQSRLYQKTWKYHKTDA